MALKHYKPSTPTQRQLVTVDRSELWKGSPLKALTVGKASPAAAAIPAGSRRSAPAAGTSAATRIIDFKRDKFDVSATVERLEYDPNRSAFIALIKYEDGELAYILAPQKLVAGDVVVAGERADIKPGNAMRIKNIPVGTVVHNIELKLGKGGQIARAAGGYAQLIGKDGVHAQLRLRSGEIRLVNSDCMATIGAVSNPDHQNIVIGKAGRSRWLGKRPVVRGVAMNPVDHPHGGGEGKNLGRTPSRHPLG